MTTEPEDRRHRTYARLTSHDDPLLREIGDQLRNGVLRPSDLLNDASYRNVLARTLRRVLAALNEVEGRDQPARGGAPPPWEDGGLPGAQRGHQ